MGRDITRRTFVKAGSAAALTAMGMGALGAASGIPAAKALAESAPPEGEWVRTTCAPNCTGACGMKAFVHDGQIKMISQAADYPFERYNPRGCLKGISINTMIHGSERLTAPLVRNEQTGELEETDWDTALDIAAQKLRDIAEKYGPDSIGVIWQVQGTGHVQKGALVRLTNMMGWSAIGGYELNGDLPMFWPETFGCQSEELESYCWEDSRYTMIFGSNPMVTRLPDSHFLNYSREAGGKVVCFDPNYSATAEKSTEWVRIKPDTDAAFALAAARVIIDEGLYDQPFCKNFTDLPLLIDTATGKRLLARDVAGLSAIDAPDYRETYVAWDEAAGAPVAVAPSIWAAPTPTRSRARSRCRWREAALRPPRRRFRCCARAWTPTTRTARAPSPTCPPTRSAASRASARRSSPCTLSSAARPCSGTTATSRVARAPCSPRSRATSASSAAASPPT